MISCVRKKNNGDWTVTRGKWRLASAWDADPHGNGNQDRFDTAIYTQNPFAWMGDGHRSPGRLYHRQANWEDYTFSVAVRRRQTAPWAPW